MSAFFRHSRLTEKGKDTRLGQSLARLGQSLQPSPENFLASCDTAQHVSRREERQLCHSQLQHRLQVAAASGEAV
jgi:hypothetical protein